MGERVLVRTQGGSSQWQRGSICKVNSEVTYWVKIEGRVVLKHVDQLVKFNDPLVLSDLTNLNSSLCNEIVEPLCTTGGTNKDWSVPDQLGVQNPVEHAQIIPETASSTFQDLTVSEVKRYPSRIRRPPERLQYT